MTATQTKIAYVVVGWNNLDLIKDCFKSITAQSYPNNKIIYVDNHSGDKSVEWVRANFPKTQILELDDNTGFAKGNNLGISEALGDPEVGFVALVNTDARLDTDWAEKILDFAQLKPKGACYQGTTLDYYDHNVIDSTHIYVSRNGQGTQGNWRKYVTSELGPRKVFGVNAAACIISRSFLEAHPFGEEVFDETIFMYLEDVDLAVRSTVMGWDNYLVPGARAYHMGSASASAKGSTFSLYMTFRNNSSMLFKNFSLKMLIKMTPRILKGDLDTIKTLWRRNQKRFIWAVVKGRIVGTLRLTLFLRKKYLMSKARKINPDYLWGLMRDGY